CGGKGRAMPPSRSGTLLASTCGRDRHRKERILSENITAPLAQFAATLRYEDLPQPVVHQACRFFLDAVGCAIGSAREDERKAGLAVKMVEGLGSTGLASVIGGGLANPAMAALGNGFLVNATDNDDTHKRAL